MSEMQKGRKVAWLSLVAGFALVGAIALVALHFSEAEQIAKLARQAKPSWLLLAIAFQVGTYLAQGQIWRLLTTATGLTLSVADAARLSIAKLFLDQALPSAGISGTASVAKYMETMGMPRAGVSAGVVVNIGSYFIANVALLVIALTVLPLPTTARSLIGVTGLLFVVGSIALVVAAFALPGHGDTRVAQAIRWRPLRNLLDAFKGADVAIVRRTPLIAKACLYQAAIVLLDVATMWTLVEASGHPVAIVAVFGSFVISNLFRSIGVLPGGLGTFDASSILTLQLCGVPLPAAVSATLLFRGLSFWLPMLPGAWYSRRLFLSSSGKGS